MAEGNALRMIKRIAKDSMNEEDFGTEAMERFQRIYDLVKQVNTSLTPGLDAIEVTLPGRQKKTLSGAAKLREEKKARKALTAARIAASNVAETRSLVSVQTYPATEGGRETVCIEWSDGSRTRGVIDNPHIQQLLARAQREGVQP